MNAEYLFTWRLSPLFSGDHVDEGGCGEGVQGAEPHHRRQEGQRQPRHPRRKTQGKRTSE